MDDQTAAASGVESAPKPRRAWLWVAVAVVVLLLAGGGGFAAWTFARTQARAAAALDIEKHWDAVSASLGAIEQTAKSAGTMTAEDAKSTVPSMLSALGSMESSATSSIAAMEQDLAALEDGEAKTAYESTIRDVKAAVGRAMEATSAIAALPALYASASKASDAVRHAHAQVNASVRSCNSKRWSQGVAAGDKAVSDCKAARAALDSMQALVNTNPAVKDWGAIAVGLKFVASERRLADAVLKAARKGRSGAMSSYNVAIRAYNKAAFSPTKAETPVFFDDPAMFAKGALDTLRTASDLVTVAGTYHQKALRASIARS